MYNNYYVLSIVEIIVKLQTDSQKKFISIILELSSFCWFGFIDINLCFSNKISYFFEIRILNVHISIKVLLFNEINFVKITPFEGNFNFS